MKIEPEPNVTISLRSVSRCEKDCAAARTRPAAATAQSAYKGPALPELDDGGAARRHGDDGGVSVHRDRRVTRRQESPAGANLPAAEGYPGLRREAVG